MANSEETTSNGNPAPYGLARERETFSLTLVSTVKPSIQCIQTMFDELLRPYHPEARGDLKTKVEFLDEGAFDRVYRIDALAQVLSSSDTELESGIGETARYLKYIFRVSLPVNSQPKISSEVATIRYTMSVPISQFPRSLVAPRTRRTPSASSGHSRLMSRVTSSLPFGMNSETPAASG